MAMTPEQLLKIEELEAQIKFLTKGLLNLERILAAEFRQMKTLIIKNHQHQVEQLKACQIAFEMNVERDELLRDTLAESCDPWH